MTTSVYQAIALDLGTTSIKAGLMDRNGRLASVTSLSAPRINVENGRYESDALDYAKVAELVLEDCIGKAEGCRTLGICSQRSSFLIWEQATGKPITPLISWQDTRGSSSCNALRQKERRIRELTGLPLTPYYFAPKLNVLLKEHPEWKDHLEQGVLKVGTLDTFLIWRWTGGRQFVTDASMAARTQLMDILQQRWSKELCELFDIPFGALSEIRTSTGLNISLDNGLTLQASIGDQSAALFSSINEDHDKALVNLGTGGFVVRYLAKDEVPLAGYLHTLVFQDKLRTHLAMEGTINSIAAALAPYPVDECVVEDLAKDDILCLAEPSGLGAPYFRGDIGIRFSDPVDDLPQYRIAVLILEAVIFRVAGILEDFHRRSAIEHVFLSGGLSSLTCMKQGIALCAPGDVYHLSEVEASLRGAAMLASGISPADHGDDEKIHRISHDNKLVEKYRRWRSWLGAQLNS